MRTSLIALLGLISLAGCASMEPEPCTRAWVDWKTEQIVKSFALSNTGEIREIRRAAQYLDGESRTGAFAIARATLTLGNLAEEFVEDVVPEVTSAIDQCGTTVGMATLFTDMLRDEGVDQRVLVWVESLSILLSPEARESL